jgi:hypothetical protein
MCKGGYQIKSAKMQIFTKIVELTVSIVHSEHDQNLLPDVQQKPYPHLFPSSASYIWCRQPCSVI